MLQTTTDDDDRHQRPLAMCRRASNNDIYVFLICRTQLNGSGELTMFIKGLQTEYLLVV